MGQSHEPGQGELGKHEPGKHKPGKHAKKPPEQRWGRTTEVVGWDSEPRTEKMNFEHRV